MLLVKMSNVDAWYVSSLIGPGDNIEQETWI